MKRLIVDLDDTISITENSDYKNAVPKKKIVEKLKQYQNDGFDIVINTSRNMRTHDGNQGKINLHTLPIILDWLKNHDIPCDEIYTAKPWCGTEGFHIDDRAIRPSEFEALTYEEIMGLLGKEK